MKCFVWSLVLTGALLVAAVPEASAHGSYDGRHIGNVRHYNVRHSHHYPQWLRPQYDFHRWYRRSHFRDAYYLSWQQLFDIYRYEQKYRRPYRHYYGGNHHRDHGRHRHH
jgi:hypothetical protein